jgi:hypothetical protein
MPKPVYLCREGVRATAPTQPASSARSSAPVLVVRSSRFTFLPGDVSPPARASSRPPHGNTPLATAISPNGRRCGNVWAGGAEGRKRATRVQPKVTLVTPRSSPLQPRQKWRWDGLGRFQPVLRTGPGRVACGPRPRNGRGGFRRVPRSVAF